MSAARKKLEEKLKVTLAPVKDKDDKDDRERQVLDLLRGFAAQVSEAVNSRSKEARRADVSIEPGHLVDLGQEYRVVIKAPDIHLSDYLLRAYVPLDGYPVDLDGFAGGSFECRSEDDLINALAELSRQRAFQERLIRIRKVLSDPDLGGGTVVAPAKKSGAATKGRSRT